MTSMREKIARVLAVRDGMHPEAVSNDEDQVPAWTLYLDDADAVLDALMEPTEGMLADGLLAYELIGLAGGVINTAEDHITLILESMITAAKEGK